VQTHDSNESNNEDLNMAAAKKPVKTPPKKAPVKKPPAGSLREKIANRRKMLDDI
jgi:hypothetical protein